MPDFFDQAKKLASEHSDLVDKGLDRAADEAKQPLISRAAPSSETATRFVPPASNAAVHQYLIWSTIWLSINYEHVSYLS